MSFFLILFLVSLLGIILLIGRKVFSLRSDNYDIPNDFEFVINVPDFEYIVTTSRKKFRKYGYITLIILIRLYVLAVHAVKRGFEKAWLWTKQKILGFKAEKKVTRVSREANKFLLKVGEYKSKIRKIKEKIKEEEGLN